MRIIVFILCSIAEMYKKLDKFSNVISYFAMREWNFKNDNTQALWKKLSPVDRELFDFNMNNLDWDAYYHTYLRGIRYYLVKDPMETIPQGRAKFLKLKILHYSVITIVLILIYFLLRLLFKIFL